MKINTLSSISAAFVLALTLSPAATYADNVYKWTDDAGNIHYSDIQPNNVDSKNIKISGGKASANRTSMQDKAQTLDERKNAELEKKAADLQANTKKRENDAQCVAIEENLKKIRDSSRVKVSENGKLRYLTPEEIAEKKKKYQDMFDKHCSN